jgi:hypothetical protein
MPSFFRPSGPDIERPGRDGRSIIVARSYRDIANAIFADQSGADHGEAAQGQQGGTSPLRRGLAPCFRDRDTCANAP